jgi:hypothetical protein
MFGRYTAILSEHEHLGTTLRRLGDMCTALEAREGAPPPPGLEPARLIGAFISELSEHFAAEEADGYFGTMARERPALASTIAELEAEHARMLETLRELLAAAGDQRRAAFVAHGVRRIIHQLRAHEHRETRVMQGFILQDEGTGAD